MRGDTYIDADDVLQDVLQTERRGRQRRAQCNQVCRDGDALRDILADYVDNH